MDTSSVVATYDSGHSSLKSLYYSANSTGIPPFNTTAS